MNNIEKIKKMIEELNKASAAYYNSGNTIMSDQEFDMKLEELKKLEDESGIILSNSPTQNPGAKVVNKINKVTHSHPMLSLDKCHSLEDIQNFMNKHDCLISIKLDGLTISAEYDKDGYLSKLETRGTGIDGNDVLFHAKSFINLPHKINKKGGYTIDGECIITYSDFESINSTLSNEDKYGNPRNLASGSLSLLDTSISKERFLRFVAWNVISGDEDNDFAQKLRNASHLGFTVVPYVIIDKGNVSNDNLQKALNRIKDLALENSYPMDGAVITQKDVAYGLSLGKTDKFFRHSIAYKYEDDSYPTILQDIDWTMGKTGVLTPTAIFEPVEIDGTIVERASMHNLSVMYGLYPNSWHSGLKVYVYKANCIIPQISKVEFSESSCAKRLDAPKICPICGKPTDVRKENESEVLVCTNENCSGKILGKLSNFVSKSCFNIDGLSEATLDLLYTYNIITDYKSIFHLSDKKDKLLRLPKFGTKKVNNLISAIEHSRKIKLENFLPSLSIPTIGRSVSKDVSKVCNGSLDVFIQKMNESYDFTRIQGFGEIMQDNLYAWWNNGGSETISDLYNEIEIVIEQKATKITGDLKDLGGKSFVITGSLNVFKNRDEAKEAIELHNGKVVGSVSKSTSYLVNNDLNSTSSKNTKAKTLGIPIISEQQLVQMLF